MLCCECFKFYNKRVLIIRRYIELYEDLSWVIFDSDYDYLFRLGQVKFEFQIDFDLIYNRISEIGDEYGIIVFLCGFNIVILEDEYSYIKGNE